MAILKSRIASIHRQIENLERQVHSTKKSAHVIDSARNANCVAVDGMERARYNIPDGRYPSIRSPRYTSVWERTAARELLEDSTAVEPFSCKRQGVVQGEGDVFSVRRRV